MGQLTECHAEKLSPAGEILHLVVAVIPLYTILKHVIWCKFHNLGEDHLAWIHDQYFVLRNTKRFSNRCSMQNSANPDISSLSKNLG